MREKTKRKILAVELVGLITLSVFVSSIFAGRAENKPYNNLDIVRNENTISSQEDIIPAVITTTQQDPYTVYFSWYPLFPDVGEKVTFFSLLDPGIWNFGDGTRGWGSVVSHIYNKKGSYMVTLSILRDGLTSGVATIEIGASPFPRFTWSPKEPSPGENVDFDASDSYDTNGQIVKYNWSYTEASEPNKVIYMGDNKTFTYAWDEQGNYNVTLAVTDNNNNTNKLKENIIVSILAIVKIKGGFRHVVFQITNIGDIAAENIQWKAYITRTIHIIPGRKIFSGSGTINTLGPGESTSVDIGRYRRAFGMITLAIIVEGSNAVKITQSMHGFILGKFVHLRHLYIY